MPARRRASSASGSVPGSTVSTSVWRTRGDATAAVAAANAVTPGTTRFLDLVVEGEDNRFVERTLRIRQLPAEEARPIRQTLIAAIPAKRGRVT